MKMSIKQQQAIAALPYTKPKYSVSQAMRKGGYAESTSKNGTNIAKVRKTAMKLGFYDPKRIEADETRLYLKADKLKDITNCARLIEGRRKVAGMITDKVKVDMDFKDQDKAQEARKNRLQTLGIM